jgi:hypothetical protein
MEYLTEKEQEEQDKRLAELPIKYLEGRTGVTVQELIDMLNKVEDKTRFVACPFFSGIEGVNKVIEEDCGGYAGTYSFQVTKIVLLQ